MNEQNNNEQYQQGNDQAQKKVNDSDWYTGPAPNGPQDKNAMNDGAASKAKTSTDDSQYIDIAPDVATENPQLSNPGIGTSTSTGVTTTDPGAGSGQ